MRAPAAALLALALAVTACSLPWQRNDSGGHVDGAESDVATPLGVSGAHAVGLCTLAPGRVVRGLGTAGYRGVPLDDKTVARTNAAEAFLNERIRPALAGIPSMWGTGYGLSCAAGPLGAIVDLSSWRDVDVAIARVAAVLEAEHVGEIVSIEVQGVPVADVAAN